MWCGVVWCGVVWCGVVWLGECRIHTLTARVLLPCPPLPLFLAVTGAGRSHAGVRTFQLLAPTPMSLSSSPEATPTPRSVVASRPPWPSCPMWVLCSPGALRCLSTPELQDLAACSPSARDLGAAPVCMQGTLVGWGYNADATLGTGAAGGIYSSPVAVSGGYTWSSIAQNTVGRSSCAILTNGAGLGGGGRRGGGGMVHGAQAMRGCSALATWHWQPGLYAHSPARTLDAGSVMCWGLNDHGQAGNGALVPSPVTSPTFVTNLNMSYNAAVVGGVARRVGRGGQVLPPGGPLGREYYRCVLQSCGIAERVLDRIWECRWASFTPASTLRGRTPRRRRRRQHRRRHQPRLRLLPRPHLRRPSQTCSAGVRMCAAVAVCDAARWSAGLVVRQFILDEELRTPPLFVCLRHLNACIYPSRY